MPSTYDTRLAAYAVIVRDGELLLALWNEPSMTSWTLPGGGVELRETPEEGAVREVREETGYDVELGPLLAVDTYVVEAADRLDGSGRIQLQVRVIYSATIVGGELTPEVGGTTDEARWFPLAEVPGLPHVDQVDVALRLLGG